MMVSRRPNLRWLLLLLVATCQSSLSFAIALIARGAAILPVTTKKTTTSRTHGRTSTSTTELRGGSVVGESAPPPQPTLAQYRNFALPCLALWVAGPLLSLVDTSFVGLASGSNSAAQLAALGPATTLYVSFILVYYTFYSMLVGCCGDCSPIYTELLRMCVLCAVGECTLGGTRGTTKYGPTTSQRLENPLTFILPGYIRVGRYRCCCSVRVLWNFIVSPYQNFRSSVLCSLLTAYIPIYYAYYYSIHNTVLTAPPTCLPF